MGFTRLERLKLSGGLSVGAAVAVRPPRVALLVPPLAGADWRAVFESALASLCGLWGGEASLVLPWSQDAEQSPAFWDILYCFDPDIVAVYSPTFSELVLMDRHRYDSFLVDVRAAVASVQGLDEDARERFVQHELEKPVMPFDPGDSFEALRKRLGVMDAIDPVGWYGLDGKSALTYPFTEAQALGLPAEPVHDPVCGLSETARLLLAARLGRLPPRLRSWLSDQGRVEKQVVDNWDQWLTLVSDRRRDRGKLTPWDATRRGLDSYQMFRPGRNVSLIVGDDPMDFALYYALSRLAPPALWLPAEGLPPKHLPYYNQSVLSDAAVFAQRFGRKEIVVTSASSPERRDEVAAELKRALRSDTLSGRPVEPHDALPRAPDRLFERDSEGRPGELVLNEAGTSQPITTPIPTDAQSATPFTVRWMTDVRVQEWAPISNAALASRLLDAPHCSTRVADAGVSYLSPVHTSFGGGTVKGVTPNPVAHRLSLVEQISCVCEQAGWEAKLSDKGVYAEQTAILFGGIQELWIALMDAETRAVLEAFRSGQSGRRFRDRMYLRMEDLPGTGASVVARHLESLGVLSRGLALKCARCRQGDFYPLASVSESFRCTRCGLNQRHGEKHWLGASEPQWHFALAEVVLQFLEHDGDIPLLAADLLMKDAVPPATVAFEIELYDPEGQKSEHDLFVALGSHLVLGEATSIDRLEQSQRNERNRLKRLALVADLLDARSIALASAAPSFSERTRKNADHLLSVPWRRVRLIEALQRHPGS